MTQKALVDRLETLPDPCQQAKCTHIGVIGSRKGTSPLRSHGTGRDSLPSSGSCR
ncbi:MULTISPECIES: hypothetical protein [Xenorhabdus]|uniref:hypothetical protein n=1 Tax=Xenorhabdus TaxID=626 RepID=UPI0013649D6C|nr:MULTISPECIES: hypothetical protein [Xenorhabdus]